MCSSDLARGERRLEVGEIKPLDFVQVRPHHAAQCMPGFTQPIDQTIAAARDGVGGSTDRNRKQTFDSIIFKDNDSHNDRTKSPSLHPRNE